MQSVGRQLRTIRKKETIAALAAIHRWYCRPGNLVKGFVGKCLPFMGMKNCKITINRWLVTERKTVPNHYVTLVSVGEKLERGFIEPGVMWHVEFSPSEVRYSGMSKIGERPDKRIKITRASKSPAVHFWASIDCLKQGKYFKYAGEPYRSSECVSNGHDSIPFTTVSVEREAPQTRQ